MSITEILGFVTGIVGVYLTVRENPLCFPVGLVNVILSLFLFVGQKLYSDAVQQGVYIILLSYGWYQWKRRTNSAVTLTVSKLSLSWIAALLPVTVLLASGMGYFFSKFTDAEMPYLDASATALSFAAQFLVARKKIENWYIWMVVNITYTGIYIVKELYLYMILFSFYFILAIMGFIQWRKQLVVATHE